ncbi:NUDIX hydrolase [Lapidilactobacillus wuchangensis]|uniref:NUDIX hydrolase n=1 Tax=Lapidilactobacillus wuchangensis TaxID=2486001 RepID=UPI000F7AFCAF|nr:NUDIX hydrolase [Lapidilactobacillus wuchangensis]
MEIRQHFGVYAVCRRDDQLLCIRKNAVPYENRSDLPGGSQQPGEDLVTTLRREFKEETGHEVLSFSHNRVYDTFVQEQGQDYTVHHIFALFDVQFATPQAALPQQVADGRNDSNGGSWQPMATLSLDNASPLVLRAVAELTNTHPDPSASRFINWPHL